VELGDGDWSILCFTDGISEALTREGRFFGHRGVAAFHQKHYALGAEDLCQGLVGEVAALHDRATLADDQTVLVLCSAHNVPKSRGTMPETPAYQGKDV
jgi:serine phosphatase RsbU (regulator of sigma subunit)